MCLASRHLKLMEEVVNGYKSDMKKMSDMISNIDIQVNTLYHEIEVERYSTVAGFKKLKKLQEALRKRRVIKNEFAEMNQLNQFMQINEISTKIEKANKGSEKLKNKNITYTDGWELNFDGLLNEQQFSAI